MQGREVAGPRHGAGAQRLGDRGWGHASPYSFLPTVPQDSTESPGTIGLENLGRARLCPPERTLGKKKGSNSGCQTSDGAQHGDVPSWPSYSPLRCCYPGSPWWLRRAQVSCSLETPPRVKPAWSFRMGIITHTHFIVVLCPAPSSPIMGCESHGRTRRFFHFLLLTESSGFC